MENNEVKPGVEPASPQQETPAGNEHGLNPEQRSSVQSAPNLQGHLDGVVGGVAEGWAWNKADPEQRLKVEILDDDTPVVTGEVGQLRPDLLASGIGDGRYGFRIPLPSTSFDGRQHLITARIADRNQPLVGEIPIKITFDGAVTGLESTSISGWARMVSEAAGAPMALSICEAGEVVASGAAHLPCDLGDCGFAIPLPSACLDGRSHTFVVREKHTGYVIDTTTVTTPVAISKGPLLSCRVAGVLENSVFGWLHIASGCDPSKLDIVVDSGVRGGKVRFGKDSREPKEPKKGTVPFVAKLGKSELPPESFRFVDRQSGKVLGSLPVPLKSEAGWGCFERIEGIYCSGWALSGDGKMARVELLVDGEVSTSSPAIIASQELSGWDLRTVNCGFRLQLPEAALDGREHEIEVRIAGSRELLAGSKRTFKYDPIFTVDSTSESYLSGWLLNRDSDDAPIRLDVAIGDTIVGSGESAIVREDVFSVYGRRLVGFHIPLDKKKLKTWKSQDIRIYFAGTRIPALPANISVVSVTPSCDLIKAVEELGAMLNVDASIVPATGRSTFPEPAAQEVIRRQLLPSLLAEIREATTRGKSIWTVNRCKETPAVSPVDIIIPVYKGYDETIACIDSVLAARSDAAFELVVINDCSPDPRLTEELRSLAGKKKFTLLENRKNLGFVATVNRGMALREVEGRDVILLNSDTVVPSGWLDALRHAAYSSPDIGTVTPFSNRATICSIPKPQFDNDMVEGFDCQAMHDICAEVNGDQVVDLPTAIGFCMYIKRRTLREVGPFDEEKWKMGYGEENDFCIKARALGWRNVAATGVFVQHHGSISFEEEKDERVRENLAILNRLYPEYPATISKFIMDDPLAEARSRISIELLKSKAPRYVLHIGHSWGGGTERAIRDLGRGLAAEGISSLIMAPDGDAVVFSCLDGTIPVRISLTNGLARLAEALKAIGVFHIHIHQLIGYPAAITELPALAGVGYDVSIHDYSLICPRVQLINNNGIFCGQPEVEICETCCSAKPLEPEIGPVYQALGGTVAKWRKFYGDLLREARMVIAPTNDACTRIQRYQSLTNIQTLPHPEAGQLGELRPAHGDRIAVAVIGAIGPHKGSELLLRCAEYAKARELPITFFIIGYTNIDDMFSGLDNVVITGKYKPADLQELIDACGCTIALFLSIWPETYSYTLSEALELGLTPVAFDLGAFRERIETVGRGVCLSYSLSPEAVVRALLKAGEGGVGSVGNVVLVGGKYRSLLADYYRLAPGSPGE